MLQSRVHLFYLFNISQRYRKNILSSRLYRRVHLEWKNKALVNPPSFSEAYIKHICNEHIGGSALLVHSIWVYKTLACCEDVINLACKLPSYRLIRKAMLA